MTTKKKNNQLLSRRETLRLLGAAGATTLVGVGDKQVLGLAHTRRAGLVTESVAAPSVLQSALFAASPLSAAKSIETLACVVRPALTEGPYFVDERLNRSDIRTDPTTGAVSAGVPLKLKFNVSRVSNSACSPLAGALVDIWHCDALGTYSDVGGAGSGRKFLRGYQVTDANGAIEFTTIYPGYYTGRTVHIHYKVRLFSGATRTYEFTSQLFFDDTLTDQVFIQAPYNTKSARGTRNNNDGIYQSGGSTTLLSVTADGQGGYTSTYDIGLSGVPATASSVSAVSAASFAAGSLASETIAALFGAGLASDMQSATALPLPTTLGNVQVRVRDAAGTERNAPLFFVSPTQINFQVPQGTSTGSATVTVLLNGSTVGQGALTIETVAPALFAANASGQGVPAAVAYRIKADGTQTTESVVQYNQTTSRFEAIPLDLGATNDQLYLVVFGTGFRNRSSLSGVTATLGGANAEVSFAGAQGSLTGVDQANIRIPCSLAGRGNVDLVFSVDGKMANTVTLSIK
jgi:uncharacterized protein (TIGR03437 family)